MRKPIPNPPIEPFTIQNPNTHLLPTHVTMETPATQNPPGLRVCTDYRTPAMDKRTQSSSSSSSSSNSSSLQLPKPMEALQEMGPPPFLLKTFEMVEDPATDSVVSWSKARNSFIVWDYCKLSVDVLPKYFKHGNFCSFVRQLNTYGFRKVDPDRYEFANEGFLGGQKHLLKTVKRRRNSPNNFPQGRTNNLSAPFKSGLESEIELLKTDKDTLMVEVLKLRQEHQDSLREIGSIEERLKGTEKKQHLTLAFLAKVIKNQSFVEKLALHNEQKKALTSGGGGGGRVDDGAGHEFVPKKRRLPRGNSTENLQNSEIETLLFKAPIQDGMVMGDTPGTGNTSWEELLNQDAFNEDEAVSAWGENVQVLVQQMGHLGSKQ